MKPGLRLGKLMRLAGTAKVDDDGGMRLVIICVGLALSLFGADDAWTKVKKLKSGTEIRIFKVGEKNGVVAKFYEADDERAVVVVKNEQRAIAKADIERLDARPLKGGGLTKTTKSENIDPAAAAGKPRTPASPAVPALASSATGVSYGGKPDFELVYRRGAPKSAQ